MRRCLFVLTPWLASGCADRPLDDAAVDECAVLLDGGSRDATIEVRLHNTRSTWIWLAPGDDCDPAVVTLDYPSWADGWTQWLEGNSCPEHAAGRDEELREGVCAPTNVLGLAPGARTTVSIPVDGWQLVEVPPRCLDDREESLDCFVRRVLPDGRYTVTALTSDTCSSGQPIRSASACGLCDPSAETCDAGWPRLGELERHEVELSFPEQTSVDLVF